MEDLERERDRRENFKFAYERPNAGWWWWIVDYFGIELPASCFVNKMPSLEKQRCRRQGLGQTVGFHVDQISAGHQEFQKYEITPMWNLELIVNDIGSPRCSKLFSVCWFNWQLPEKWAKVLRAFHLAGFRSWTNRWAPLSLSLLQGERERERDRQD